MRKQPNPKPTCALHPSLHAGLVRDLASWKMGSITRHALDAGLNRIPRGESDITTSFGLYNGTLFWLNPHKFPVPRNPHIYAIADDLKALAQLHTLPDVEFNLNVDDYPKADGRVKTAAHSDAPTVAHPLFSYTKRESESGATRDHDVLIPSGAFRMALYEHKLLARTIGEWERIYPWASKRGAAYFRGTPYCGIHNFGRCSRYVLARLAHDNRSDLLDVGLVEYNSAHDTELHHARRHGLRSSGALRQAARRDESAYGTYKYLLHLDGHSFSNRLQSLLLSNSLVLKQQSVYTEYYYRALRPWEHYVPFYRDSAEDILDVLPNVTRFDDDARAIARRGQAFVHSHLHVDGRMCYWRHLLHGWRRRLAFVPDVAERPHARRVRLRDYVCGECRRTSNPELIGPWAADHPCAKAGASSPDTSVRQCRRPKGRRATK